MILSKLIQYVSAQKRVALRDLSLHLGTTPDALRGMLGVLERKGRVRRLPAGTACGGGCSLCDPVSVELYEWVGGEGAPRDGGQSMDGRQSMTEN